MNHGIDAPAEGSGLDATTILKRDAATLDTTTETCGAFAGTFATTVTLVGGADTTVVSGNCYEYRYVVSDLVGNSTTYTSASVAKVDTSGPHVTAITSLQSNGATGNGQLQVGDKLVLTFNQSLASSSVPTTFSGATEIDNVLAPDTLTIPGITDGALNTGGFLYAPTLGTATFAGTVLLSDNGTATTVTITVTSVSTGLLTPLASSGPLAFKPATTIHDGGGNSAAGTLTMASTFKLF